MAAYYQGGSYGFGTEQPKNGCDFLREQIGIKASNRLELSEYVKEGFPYQAFVSLSESMDLTNKQLAELVQISERTLVRRSIVGRLKAEESERSLRFFRLFTMAVELFDGDRLAAQGWLASESRALQGQSLLEISKTEVGAREVENLITRLKLGVFT